MTTPVHIGVPLQVTPVGKRQEIMAFIVAHPPDRTFFEDEGEFSLETFMAQQKIQLDNIAEPQLDKILTLISLFPYFKVADGECPTAAFGPAYLFLLQGVPVVVGQR